MKIAKRENKRTYLHDENPDRRVKSPDWYFSQSFIQRLKDGAKENDLSISHFFEKVIQNFLILENTRVIIVSRRDYNLVYSKKRSPSLSLHPEILEKIKEYAEQSNTSSSKYIEVLFDNYFFKYKYEIRLKNLLKYF